jgi:cobalt-precorrin 5A hydrolase/precorrin-3B C17-methyltransferase
VIGLVYATGNGEGRARALEGTWNDVRLFSGPPREAVAAAWGCCDALLLLMATGVAVRLIAPLLADKHRDPAVVAVDDAARFAVALVGGHWGANDLARRVGRALGAVPVVTTASDALGLPSLDSLGADLGFVIEKGSDLATVGAALVSGRTVALVEDARWPLPALPPGVVRGTEASPPCVVITDRAVKPPRPSVVFRPRSLIVGAGCSRGALASEILGLIECTLQEGRLTKASIAKLASVELKRDEKGLIEASRTLGVPLSFHTADELAEVVVPNPSEAVAEAVGTPSVAEASVLAAGAELIVEKRASANATVAIGRLAPRGRLYLVGTGPGNEDLVPPAARDVLARCEIVIGLDRYIEQVRPLLRPYTRVEVSGIGDEIARAERAAALAATGCAVALISGGDAGVYAMASPALERISGNVDVEVVPGITAALAAAALLGAPLGHDHCSMSLSDLLTPWQLIRERVRAAAQGDFVAVFYNPRSRHRHWQLLEARDLLLEYRKPDTPVGIVTNAYRPAQRVGITTLADLDVDRIGMTTTVVVGNSLTRVIEGRMVTPRGYR